MMKNLIVFLLLSSVCSASTFIDDRTIVPRLELKGPLIFNNQITPTIIGEHTNNYSPAGLAETNYIRISFSGNYELRGIVAPIPVANKLLFITNIGSDNMKIKNESSLSTAENRFTTTGDLTIKPGESVILIYDTTSLRWRILGYY
jgi:hypothetical protein